MIKRNRRGHSYCDARGEILGPSQDETTAKAFAKNVSINQERKLEDRRRSDTALVLTINDATRVRLFSQRHAGKFRETKKLLGSGEVGCKAET
ncbi:hypothetical protein JTE90_015631 [Oedothorax gibbosus]|uniref:Uncharacterized protein n=1 Tax=Oedothorax gibbosus TaxID=931172 RepID=A0AAV6TEC3_9ARAC|nr:hypothetical protein JTE90_015631 [Oedothorax gibbosus]